MEVLRCQRNRYDKYHLEMHSDSIAINHCNLEDYNRSTKEKNNNLQDLI